MADKIDNNADEWDFERATRHTSSRRARAVVSVAFTREAFDKVATAAETLQMKVSEFIRAASLAVASQQLVVDLSAEPTTSQAHWSYVSSPDEVGQSTASEGRHLLERLMR